VNALAENRIDLFNDGLGAVHTHHGEGFVG